MAVSLQRAPFSLHAGYRLLLSGPSPPCYLGSLPKPNGVILAKGKASKLQRHLPSPTCLHFVSIQALAQLQEFRPCGEFTPSRPPISLRNCQEIKKIILIQGSSPVILIVPQESTRM